MPQEGRLEPAGVKVTEGEVGTTPDVVYTEGLQMVEQGLQIIFGAMGDRLPTKQVTIEPGSTLWAIAEEELGDGQRWREIYMLNLATTTSESEARGVEPSPDFIFPGTELKLLAF